MASLEGRGRYRYKREVKPSCREGIADVDKERPRRTSPATNRDNGSLSITACCGGQSMSAWHEDSARTSSQLSSAPSHLQHLGQFLPQGQTLIPGSTPHRQLWRRSWPQRLRSSTQPATKLATRELPLASGRKEQLRIPHTLLPRELRGRGPQRVQRSRRQDRRRRGETVRRQTPGNSPPS
jgi:hypothetical protein